MMEETKSRHIGSGFVMCRIILLFSHVGWLRILNSIFC